MHKQRAFFDDFRLFSNFPLTLRCHQLSLTLTLRAKNCVVVHSTISFCCSSLLDSLFQCLLLVRNLVMPLKWPQLKYLGLHQHQVLEWSCVYNGGEFVALHHTGDRFPVHMDTGHPLWQTFLDSGSISPTQFFRAFLTPPSYFHSPTPWQDHGRLDKGSPGGLSR